MLQPASPKHCLLRVLTVSSKSDGLGCTAGGSVMGIAAGEAEPVVVGVAIVACLPLVELPPMAMATTTMMPTMNRAIPAATPTAILVMVNCRRCLDGCGVGGGPHPGVCWVWLLTGEPFSREHPKHAPMVYM